MVGEVNTMVNNLSDPKHLIAGYQLCASTEGNSINAIIIMILCFPIPRCATIYKYELSNKHLAL
jgi:hypothetical protein